MIQFNLATNDYRGGAEKSEYHVKGKVHPTTVGTIEQRAGVGSP